ncbi:aldehyde dehydrogenase family protein, partial [Nocardia sp. NPDC060220]|uniref:aldehyde dehydrogenase family protein n=1 Tax=Nocardia sp. NPDC060220 TaxID=3347076 RepID=UPI003649BE53
MDGEFTEAADGQVFKTLSPSTEEVLSEVARAGAEDVDRAVRAARRAFGPWS